MPTTLHDHPTHPSPRIDWARVRQLVRLMLAGDLAALRELADVTTVGELLAALDICNQVYAVSFRLSEVRP